MKSSAILLRSGQDAAIEDGGRHAVQGEPLQKHAVNKKKPVCENWPIDPDASVLYIFLQTFYSLLYRNVYGCLAIHICDMKYAR